MNTSDPSDQELMIRFKAGDHSAFSQLVLRWDPRITKALARLVGQTADIDDLRQEAFLRVLLHKDRYRTNYAFSTWMYRITINLARDHARRRRFAFLAFNGQRLMYKNGQPPQADSIEISQLIEKGLASLPQHLREVLVLKYFSELSFADISYVLSLPASTAKSRAYAALKRLRSELRRLGVVDEMETENELC